MCVTVAFFIVKYVRNSPDCVTMAVTVLTQELHMQHLYSVCIVCGDRLKR